MTKGFTIRDTIGSLSCDDCDFKNNQNGTENLLSLKKAARRHCEKFGHKVKVTYLCQFVCSLK